MKRFVGGSDGMVAMLDDAGIVWLGKYQWGDQSASHAAMAKTILAHVLDDNVRAEQLHRIVIAQHRGLWTKGRNWTYTDAQILAVIDDIERIKRETAADVRRMAREPPKGAFVGHASIADGSEWDNNPEIQRNDPRKAR